MIGIILLTFARFDYACKTLESVATNLRSSESLWLHVADDGSEQTYRDTLFALAQKHFGERVSITNSERGGYGASYNLATQAVHSACDLILPLEDDWELTRPLDLDPIVGVLRDGTFGCVRLGYIGYTDELRGKFVWARGLHWLALDPASPEKHVFTGGPRLETREFEQAVGPWPEGLFAGDTELAVCGRTAARLGVAWPVDLIRPSGDAWGHIGTERAAESPLRLKEVSVA